MIDEKMAESNNSLGSIASISKNEGYGEKKEKKKKQEQKEKGASDVWRRERDGRKDT